MAALATKNPTLMDVANRLEPNGKTGRIAELLSQTNEILDDMTFIEGNHHTGTQAIVRIGLPQATWRKLYGGVPPNKSRTAKIMESCGSLEAYAEIDKALADINGNTEDFRLSEDQAFFEAMSQQFATALFYESEATKPEAITGFDPRFNSTAATNGENIILADSGASGSDQTSIWLVVWGPNTVHGIYPKGSKAGLQITPKSTATIEDVDGNGGRMEAYRTHYRWDVGLCVRDWRYVVRIANIDTSGLTSTGTTGTKLIDCMLQAVERVPNLKMGRPAFYCNRTVRTFLRRQLAEKLPEQMDSTTLKIAGVPVRRVDAILNTEAVVS